MISFTPFPVFSSERMELRQFDLADQAAIFELRTNPQVNAFTDRPTPQHLEDVCAFINKIRTGIAADEMISWGMYLKGSTRMIGSIGYWKFNEAKTSADIGYELHPEFWRKGLMQEAYAATLPFVFGPMGLESIDAWVNTINKPSIRFLERNGFEQIKLVPAGEAGDSTDMFVYRLTKP